MLSNFFKAVKKYFCRSKVRVDKTMRDYSKEEFFVKKAESAKDLFNKYGYPQELSSSK